MKRLTYAIAGVVAVGAIWTGGWFAGKSFLIEPEADRIVEELRAGELFFSYESREVGGFPIAYDVAYRGVRIASSGGGWEWTTPEMSVASGVADGGAVVITPADETKLVIDATAFGGAPEDAPAVFDLVSGGFSVTLTEQARRFALVADRIEAKQAAGGGALKDGAAVLSDLDAAGQVAMGGDEAEVEVTASEARIEYVFSPDGVAESRSSTTMRGVTATFSGERLAAGGLAGFIEAGGDATLTIAVESADGVTSTTGGPGAPSLDYEVKSGPANADIAASEGRVRYTAKAAKARYALATEQPSLLPSGALTVGEADFLIDIPVAKTEDAAPYSIRLGFADVALDDGVWATFDPEAKIDRTPLTLEADLSGEARVIHALGGDSFGEPPIDLETLDISRLSLTGLGASLEATGALTIPGDAATPEGEVTVEARGIFALLDRIGAAGLMPPGQIEIYKALALGYARQGDGPDHLIAEIETSRFGLSVNGKQVR